MLSRQHLEFKQAISFSVGTCSRYTIHVVCNMRDHVIYIFHIFQFVLESSCIVLHLILITNEWIGRQRNRLRYNDCKFCSSMVIISDRVCGRIISHNSGHQDVKNFVNKNLWPLIHIHVHVYIITVLVTDVEWYLNINTHFPADR